MLSATDTMAPPETDRSPKSPQDLTRPELIAGSFYVAFHDIAPRFARQIDIMADALMPLLGRQWSAAVVPGWHGDRLTPEDRPFLESVQERFGEILLHGFSHRRDTGRGLVSAITGGQDEFNGLSLEETADKLRDGQVVIKEFFGAPARGFIAPTFQRGRLTPALLREHGMEFLVGYRCIDFADQTRVPIATWCWDVGDPRPLCVAGDWYGHLRMRLYRNLIPCLALHPADIDRGFLPRIVRLIESLREQEREPILLETCLPEA